VLQLLHWGGEEKSGCATADIYLLPPPHDHDTANMHQLPSSIISPTSLSPTVNYNKLPQELVVDGIKIYAENMLLHTAERSSQAQLHDRVHTELDVHTLNLQIPTHTNIYKNFNVKATIYLCRYKMKSIYDFREQHALDSSE